MIKFYWQENPLGNAYEDPDTGEYFETGPISGLALDYREGNTRLRQAVNTKGLIKDLPLERKHQMKRLLIKWLRETLKS